VPGNTNCQAGTGTLVSSKDKHTKSQAKQANNREEMPWLLSALLLTSCVAVFFSVRCLTVDLQEEGYGKSQDKGIAAHFKAYIWGASYQDPAHAVCQCAKQVICSCIKTFF